MFEFSFSSHLWIYHDFLVAAVSEALASQTVLKSLDLRLDGQLISFSANFLEKCLIENSSLNHLRVYFQGDSFANWQSVVENLRLTKTSAISCSIYQDTWNNIVDNHFRLGLNRQD